MREPRERLRHMLEAIENIERYADRGERAFEQDELLRTWLIRNLQIIGEAARALPATVRERAPGVPWTAIIGMRNVLVHDYIGIEPAVLWDAVERDLPRLKPEVERLLRELEADPDA